MFGTANAQVSYGVRAGVNLGNIKGDDMKTFDLWGLSSESRNLSFHVTAYADVSVAPSFSIQPGVSIQGKGKKYNVSAGEDSGYIMTNLLALEVPVNAVYYIPTGNIGRVFIGAGPYVGFNVSGENIMKAGSEKRSNDLKFTGDVRKYNRVDAGLNFLGGYMFNNGFLIHTGYGLGLTDLSRYDGFGPYNNRVLSFGMGFEF